MFDWLVENFAHYPYAGVAIVFLLCGLGLPLPEEIVLVAAGYVTFKGFASFGWMMAACAGSILAGDAVPFLLGRVYGPRLLRLRALRTGRIGNLFHCHKFPCMGCSNVQRRRQYRCADFCCISC